MSQIKQVGSLEIGEDINFQHTEWRVQRIGWIVMGLILLAALIGVFGIGPVSKTTEGDDILQVSYDRFYRLRKPMTFEITVGANAVTGNEIRLWMDRDYVSKLSITRIIPMPSEVEISNDRVYYTFKVAETDGPITILVDGRYPVPAIVNSRLGLDDGPTVDFTQIIYP